VMETLYDTLDIHPDDDAGEVRDAFRKAVKASHPDLNAGDPDAPARFRQIVRANAILADPELRSIYDRMLEFERQRLPPTSKPTTVFDVARNIVPDAIVIVVLAAVMAGAFTLYTYISEISAVRIKVAEVAAHEPPMPNAVAATANEDGPEEGAAHEPPMPNAVAATANEDGPEEGAAHEPPTAVVSLSPPGDATAGNSSPNKPQGAEAPVPSADAATPNSYAVVDDDAREPNLGDPAVTSTFTEVIPSDSSTPSSPVKDAQFYRERGIESYHNRDFPQAVTDFDRAIKLEPNFEGAYIDRSIALYRMGEFNRAFADIAQAMRIENIRRAEIPPLPKARPD
jgi:tetratricopeptide (TPR) repeat protein